MNGIGERAPRWGWKLLVVLIAGLLLGRLGPFGTFGELTTSERYAYWIGLTLLMWLQGVALLALIDQPLSRRVHVRWARVAVAALLAAVPTAFEVAWAEMLLRVERDLGPLDILAIAGDVALLSFPLLLLTHGWVPAAKAAHSKPSVNGGPEFLVAMMEPKRRGRLFAVSSEDHYVRLYSEQGHQLVAMRFGDAIARLDGEHGQQVHRRWWVSNDAVDRFERAGDGMQLTLRNGLIVPVSRSYLQQSRKQWSDRIV